LDSNLQELGVESPYEMGLSKHGKGCSQEALKPSHDHLRGQLMIDEGFRLAL